MTANLLVQVEYDPAVTDKEDIANHIETALWSAKDGHKALGFVVSEVFIVDDDLEVEVEEEEPGSIN
jgi:hypothetical protein